MVGRKLNATDVPTPGPWLVRGEADATASPSERVFGVVPATEGVSGGWPYIIREDRRFEPGECPLHIAVGIQRLADARLIAAAPDLASALLSLLTAPNLMARNLDPRTGQAITVGWSLLVRVAPHLEIGP